MITSCSMIDDDMPEQFNETTPSVSKQVDLLVSIGSGALKSSLAPALTHRAPTFSAMDQLVAIPFHTSGEKVEATDEPLIDLVGLDEDDMTKEYDAEKYNTYYVDRCNLMTGTDRMLVYGKAKPAHSDLSYDPKVHGQLSALPTIRKKTADIQFSLTSIRESTEASADANALANYMTTIANTPGWSTTTVPTLKSYYLDFIRMGSEGAGLMSGAAANIKAFVAALKALLTGSDALSTAIIANIDGTNISGNDYPRSLGLPDGAAAIRWTGSQFEVKTTTTQLDNINGINTYPAELMFFADSPIRTSAEEVTKTVYQENTETWDAFLDTYYNGSTAVNTNTKAVAVENPIQYGVAKLNLTLTGMSPTLSDAKNEVVLDADMAHLPLTGVIIGGQHTVGFNMKPQGAQTDVDGRFIYETTVDATNLATEGYKTSTLVAFTGKDGTVYPETRFYLIGMIDPADKKEEGKDYTNRVFTQDYTTTMSMSVTSLAKAYTCMPDLLAPRLEVGVQVVTKWIQATTTNVELR